MSDWRDVMNARTEADDAARDASRHDANFAVVVALESLRLELRALATLIDFARGDAR